MNPMIIYLNVNCLTLIVSRDYGFATDVYVEENKGLKLELTGYNLSQQLILLVGR